MRTLLTALLLLLASEAHAQTTRPALSASLGFDGVFKPDAWVPVYVRVADTIARPATIEVRAARGRLGHSVSARIATSTTPATYTLYAPLSGLDRAGLQLRDANGKLIRGTDLTDQAQQSPAALGGPAIGISSHVDAAAQRVATQLIRGSSEYVAAGVVATRLLPERAIGYACLDVLVLPELDTDTLDDDVEGAILAWVRTGGIVVAWRGARAPTLDSPLRDALPSQAGDGVSEMADAYGLIFSRRLGLGQVVFCDFDPSAVPADERIAEWRRLTAGQVSMSPDDRRAGVFDPLVRQAVGEQALRMPSMPSGWFSPLLFAGLLFGLIAGPGEAAILLASRRGMRTWYTIGGTVLLVASGVGFAFRAGHLANADARIDVTVEVDGSVVERSSLAASTREDDSILWLAGDRPDAADRPAAELRLGQRDERFEPLGLVGIGGEAAKVRSVDLSPATQPSMAIDAASPSRVSNRSASGWDAVAIASRDDLRVQVGIVAGGAAADVTTAPTPADQPGTRRVETGVERLAGTPGWEAIFFDRRLAERLVRLQETENIRIVVARGTNGATRRFVIRVERRE